MKKLKVAVTGNIGSGKSTVCNFFEMKGYPVIYADNLAKDLYHSNRELKELIISNFGENLYEGEIFRRDILAKIVFSDKTKLVLLNAIVHPIVIQENRKLMELFLQKNDIVFHEAALIFEAGMEKEFDKIVLVTASETTTAQRLSAKRGISEKEYHDRLSGQLPVSLKIPKSDFIIENDGSEQELLEKTEVLLKSLTILIQ